MLTDKQIRDIFIECTNTDPEGLYANDVDILEYGRKLDAESSKRGAMDEREVCIKFVKTLNTEVAKALEDWRKWTDRSMS